VQTNTAAGSCWSARLGVATALLAALACAHGGRGADAVPPNEKRKLAVLEFEVDERVGRESGLDRLYFSDKVRGAAQDAAPLLLVMTRENIEVLAEANGKSLAECESQSCEVETGQKLGADYVIGGRISRNGSRLVLTMRLHSTADGGLLKLKLAEADDADALTRASTEEIAELIAALPGATRSPNDTSPAANSKEGHVAGKPKDVRLGAQDVMVRFDTAPASAVVLVDGALLCQATPCSKMLSPGPHRARAEKEGFEPFAADLLVAEGARVSMKLLRSTALVAVLTTPPGIAIAIDGKPAGRSPLAARDLPPGAHSILVEDPCWVGESEQIVVAMGDERTVQIAPAEKLAGLVLRAEDSKGNVIPATALLDGRLLGKAPRQFEVPACGQRLGVSSAGFADWTGALELHEGQTLTRTVTLVEKLASPEMLQVASERRTTLRLALGVGLGSFATAAGVVTVYGIGHASSIRNQLAQEQLPINAQDRNQLISSGETANAWALAAGIVTVLAGLCSAYALAGSF
jgi:hypothetical protein